MASSKRGFASMDLDKQRLISSKGGKASHQKGNAHEFTSEEAKIAGSKGGRAAHEKGTAHEFTAEEAREAGRRGGELVSADREHMAQIGRKGGEARAQNSLRNQARSQEGLAPVTGMGSRGDRPSHPTMPSTTTITQENAQALA
ncbi:MAG: general stress protein [Planctomycetes bacterium]|nr:general stress protein [Planctomycetota bacterium]